MAPLKPNRLQLQVQRGLVVISFLLMNSARPLTLDELQKDSQLTPKSFAKKFRDFAFQEHVEVQDPDVFLVSRAGDCDDFAIVADMVLKPKGYDTRLVAVRMPGLIAHVVCYVAQEKGYLDYNNRAYASRIEHSGPTLRDIAARVAKSFSANWTSASEFTYLGNSMKRLVATVAKTDSTGTENVSRPGIKVDF